MLPRFPVTCIHQIELTSRCLCRKCHQELQIAGFDQRLGKAYEEAA